MEKSVFRTLCLVFLLSSASVFSQGGNDFLGQILYHDNYPISGVNAYLHNSSGAVVDSAVTDVEGFYEFLNVTPGNYTITFSTSQPEGGIELSDAFLVMLHMFNMYPFDEIQFLAADVNGSNTITWSDYLLILIGYLNQGNPFPVGPWVFESISTPIPVDSRTFVSTGGGSSSGDVNGSLVPDPKGTPIFIDNPIVNLVTDPAQSVEFNISGGQDLQLAGMHLSLEIPEEIELLDIESPIQAANIFVEENHINVTWLDESMQGYNVEAGESLIVLKTRVKKPSRNAATYSLKLGDNSHFINTSGELIRGVSLIMPTLDLQFAANIGAGAFPNPFKEQLTIEYQIRKEGNVCIELYDHAGRMVREIENAYRTEGTYQVTVDGRALLPGIYHYAIRVAGEEQASLTGTIIKSK